MTHHTNETPATKGEAAPGRDDAVVAGRGFLFITAAKVYFLVTSTIINIGLPRLLGDPARFGEFKVVNTLISIINMVMITGTIQAVSKMVSEQGGAVSEVRKKAMLLQAFVGGALFLLLFLGADLIADDLLSDPGLALYIRIASFIVLFYAFYAIFVGLLNGLKKFHLQATLDVTFSTMKTGLIVALVLIGLSVTGTFVGFSTAAFLVLIVAFVMTRKLGRGESSTTSKVSMGRIAGYLVQIMLYTLMVNLILQLDVILIKAMRHGPILEWLGSGEGQRALTYLTGAFGVDPSALDPAALGTLATERASTLAGLFGAVKNVSMIPYQAIISITFVVFPMVSASAFNREDDTTRGYITQTFRFSIVLIAWMVVVILADPGALVQLLFGSAYSAGAGALGLLLGATVLFALFFVANTIITGSGHPTVSLVVGIATAVATTGAVVVALLWSDLWTGTLEAVALALLIAMSLGFVACLVYIVVTFKALVPLGTVLRVVAAVAVVVAITPWLPLSGVVGLLVKAAIAGIVYPVILIVTREFTKDDLAKLKRILPGRKKA